MWRGKIKRWFAHHAAYLLPDMQIQLNLLKTNTLLGMFEYYLVIQLSTRYAFGIFNLFKAFKAIFNDFLTR